MINALENHRKALFWSLMVLAQVGAFLIFKDLADISQWVVQSSREFTMGVWYNRWPLALLTLLALGCAVFLWWGDRGILGGKWVVLLVFLCLFNWYAGMLNTLLMFRPQQEAAQAMFVSVEEAPQYLEQMLYASYETDRFSSVDEISVIVLETDAGARAYTDYYLLQPHVVAGGEVDGEEVIMTYCGLTNMGVAYSPVIDGQRLQLRVMTQLRNNLVMWDTNSGEPVQQFWGTLERDGEQGPAMRQYPTLRMPFGSFRELYPDGEVFVNGIPQQSGNPLVRLWDTVVRDGMMLHAVRTLQWRTDEPAFPTIEEFDERLPRKQLVYGINVGDDYVAYTKQFIREQGGLLNVKIGGRSLVIYLDPQYDSVAAYYNDSGNPVTSVDLFGRSDQGKLARVETMKSDIFWFIWYEFYRGTDVNRVS
jgi:hypothetical protein